MHAPGQEHQTPLVSVLRLGMLGVRVARPWREPRSLGCLMDLYKEQGAFGILIRIQ